MCIKKCAGTILVGLVTVGFVGCDRGVEPKAQKLPAAAAGSNDFRGPLLVAHWVGRDRLASDTNAAGLMKIWQMPESLVVQDGALDKLAAFPWRLWGINTNSLSLTEGSALLRPLLQDLVEKGCCLEVREENGKAELALSAQLDQEKSRTWDGNLSKFLEVMTGSKPQRTAKPGDGWTLAKSTHLGHVQLLRIGEWTVFGCYQDGSSLLDDVVARITRTGSPRAEQTSNSWLRIQADTKLVPALGLLPASPATNLSNLELIVTGDGENVRTRVELNLSKPGTFAFSSWQIPTNLIHQPLVSFTATRDPLQAAAALGLTSKGWPFLLPGQAFLWDRSGAPLQTYFAFPCTNSTNWLSLVAPFVSGWVNRNVEPQRFGSVTYDTNSWDLVWNGLPFVAPFLQSATNHGQEYVFGGFGVHVTTRTKFLPGELANHLHKGTNLVFFEWENTGDRLGNVRYLDDTARIVLDSSHVSRFGVKSPQVAWAVNLMTNLSHSVTEVKLTKEDQFTLTRKSTIGLTALEINFLLNWLENRCFPFGSEELFTTRKIIPEPSPRKRPAADRDSLPNPK